MTLQNRTAVKRQRAMWSHIIGEKRTAVAMTMFWRRAPAGVTQREGLPELHSPAPVGRTRAELQARRQGEGRSSAGSCSDC